VSLTRRRGEELENALLEAAYAELAEGGYAAFTFDRVAERARTSRPVLARRWATREDLILASIQHHHRTHPLPVPDTGSLRGDLIAVLTLADQHRTQLLAPLMGHLGGYFQETGRTLAGVRREMIAGRETSDHVIIQRALARGEIDPARLTPRISGLAFDLFRHEALMTGTSVPVEVLTEIVDTIVLPLLTGNLTPASDRSTPAG
jgi:AcrR family transcriptional regulator